MSDEHNFYLTFGQQYRRVGHPTWKPAHPDGYVRVVAADIIEARRVALRWFGQAWADVYSEDKFEQTQKFYGLGELGVATLQTLAKSQTSDTTQGDKS